MQSFRVAKPARKTKSSKPRPSTAKHSFSVVDILESSFDNLAIVAYSFYMAKGVLCYYDRE